MKITVRCAAVLACLLGLSLQASQLMAQAPAPRRPAARPSGGAVAVIDISKIFKDHKRFKKMLDDLKRDVQAAENEVKQDRDLMQKKVEELKRYKSGTPTYKKLEEEIATWQSQMQVKINLQKRDFMEAEAKIYFQVYNEIQNEVKYFAQRHGIGLVLRYNSAEIKANDRQSVHMGINKAVVYQNSIDITFDILDRLQPPERADNRNQFPR